MTLEDLYPDDTELRRLGDELRDELDMLVEIFRKLQKPKWDQSIFRRLTRLIGES